MKCPSCKSPKTERTATTVYLIWYRCLDCGTSFSLQTGKQKSGRKIKKEKKK